MRSSDPSLNDLKPS